MTTILLTLPASHDNFVSLWESIAIAELGIGDLLSRFTVREFRGKLKKARMLSGQSLIKAKIKVIRVRGTLENVISVTKEGTEPESVKVGRLVMLQIIKRILDVKV